jgi:antitoxin ParD1/3/4
VPFTAKLSAMIVRKTRNVSLTPELEAFIDSTVASGRYRSASEVVRAALRLLSEREQRMKHQNRQAANAPHLDR